MTSRRTLRRAVIFHGYGATPEDHWFGWLAGRLEADGIQTTIPALPNPLAPGSEQWEAAARSALGTPNEQAVVVAHSLGCLTALRALRSLAGSWRLGALVLVSGFVDPLPVLPGLDGFIAGGCDLSGLRDRINRIAIIRSDDDPLVPPAHTDRLADLFGVKVQEVPGAGHFLADDGITELPAAYDALTPQ
ncbi:alpha/beta hydrolase [Kocuria carniphila]|uniref:Alpha/beta hydrolase n=1 Tax=Kocuria carniphila TaxID=262208 RepID=A0ABV3V9H8_9MICC